MADLGMVVTCRGLLSYWLTPKSSTCQLCVHVDKNHTTSTYKIKGRRSPFDLRSPSSNRRRHKVYVV